MINISNRLNIYVKNISWLFIEKIVRMFFSFFVGLWVARYLGPNDFGILSFSLSVVTLLSCLSSMGIDSLIVREFVNNKYSNDILLTTAIFIRIFGSFIMLTVVCIFGQYGILSNIEMKLALIFCLFFLFQSTNIIYLYFQSQIKNIYPVIATIISLVVSNCIKIYCIYFNKGIIYIGWCYVSESVISSLILVYMLKIKTNIDFIFHIDKKILFNLIKCGFPLFMSVIAVQIYMKTDQIMLSSLEDKQSVGIYAAASRLSENLYIIPIVICNVLFPSILNSKKNRKEYLAKFKFLYQLMFVFALLLCISISIFSKPIINILYGESFAIGGTSEIFKLHVWTAIFVFIGVANGKWMIAENLQKYSMIYVWIGALLNIALNYYLIPLYSGIGAAVATLTSQAISAYFALLIFKKTRTSFWIISKSFYSTELFKRCFCG